MENCIDHPMIAMDDKIYINDIDVPYKDDLLGR